MRDSTEYRVRRQIGNWLMGTLWERAQYADTQMLNLQKELARQSE